MTTSFALLMKELRFERKLSGRQIARMSGVCQPQISKIESGENVPELGTLRALGKALKLTPEKMQLVELMATRCRERRGIPTVGGKGHSEYWQGALADEAVAMANAKFIKSFNPTSVPGILRLPQYLAKGQILSADWHLPGALPNAQFLSKAREHRYGCAIEHEDTIQKSTFILSEYSLSHSKLPLDLHILQIEYLAEVAKRYGNIHVIESGVLRPKVVKSDLPHGFGILGESTVVVELLHELQLIHDLEVIALYDKKFEGMKLNAVSGDAALAVILEMIHWLKRSPESRKAARAEAK
jgi:transcriptional regulator with XRE-family HTH domain